MHHDELRYVILNFVCQCFKFFNVLLQHFLRIVSLFFKNISKILMHYFIFFITISTFLCTVLTIAFYIFFQHFDTKC